MENHLKGRRGEKKKANTVAYQCDYYLSTFPRFGRGGKRTKEKVAVDHTQDLQEGKEGGDRFAPNTLRQNKKRERRERGKTEDIAGITARNKKKSLRPHYCRRFLQNIPWRREKKGWVDDPVSRRTGLSGRKKKKRLLPRLRSARCRGGKGEEVGGAIRPSRKILKGKRRRGIS